MADENALLDSRLRFQEALEEILGSEEVYFQPPSSVRMAYPAIVYHRASEHSAYANNAPYIWYPCYDVTLIDPDPDSEFVKKIRDGFRYCFFQRPFTADNLNHYLFRIYYY